MMSLGFIASAYSSSIPILLSSFGVISGIGASLVYLPSCVAVGYYFESRRSLATGITRVGSSLGQFVYALLGTLIYSHFGLKITILSFAGLAIFCSVLGLLMRPLVVSNDNKMKTKGHLYKTIFESKPKDSKKNFHVFSRLDTFHQGSMHNLFRANKVSSHWDQNRHILFSTPR